MSKEHIFSQATARKHLQAPMAVQGVANMHDGPIGPDGPKARILCQLHNSILSTLDSEAKKLADGLHQFVDGAPNTTVHLSGLLLERWALKAVINFMAAGFGHTNKWLPNDDLVRIVFGLDAWPKRCGLYLLRIENYQPISAEQTGVTPAWMGSSDGASQELMGAVVYLHGATFFLLLQTHFLEALQAGRVDLSKSHFPLTYDRLTYHPIAARIDDDQGRTMIALFDWTAASSDTTTS
jgi:hypothetical protein